MKWFCANFFYDNHKSIYTIILNNEQLDLKDGEATFFCVGQERGDHIKVFIFASKKRFETLIHNLLSNTELAKASISPACFIEESNPFFKNFPANTIHFPILASNETVKNYLNSIKDKRKLIQLSLFYFNNGKPVISEIDKILIGIKILLTLEYVGVISIEKAFKAFFRNKDDKYDKKKISFTYRFYKKPLLRYFQNFEQHLFKSEFFKKNNSSVLKIPPIEDSELEPFMYLIAIVIDINSFSFYYFIKRFIIHYKSFISVNQISGTHQ